MILQVRGSAPSLRCDWIEVLSKDANAASSVKSFCALAINTHPSVMSNGKVHVFPAVILKTQHS